jgi:hypothetical protein
LSDLLGQELEIVATSQRQKNDLERMKSYSVNTLFKLLDVNGYKFLSPSALQSFMLEQADETNRRQPSAKRLSALMRRLMKSSN